MFYYRERPSTALGVAHEFYTKLNRGDRVFCAGVMVMVEKGGEVVHSAASSALAASRAFFLLMPTSALQAVSFNRAPSAMFIW